MAPVAPTGWPSTIAPLYGFTFAGSRAAVADHGNRLRCKRLVDLVHVDVIRSCASPLEQVGQSPDRGVAHDLEVHGCRSGGFETDEAGESPIARPTREHDFLGKGVPGGLTPRTSLQPESELVLLLTGHP